MQSGRGTCEVQFILKSPPVVLKNLAISIFFYEIINKAFKLRCKHKNTKYENPETIKNYEINEMKGEAG